MCAYLMSGVCFYGVYNGVYKPFFDSYNVYNVSTGQFLGIMCIMCPLLCNYHGVHVEFLWTLMDLGYFLWCGPLWV